MDYFSITSQSDLLNDKHQIACGHNDETFLLDITPTHSVKAVVEIPAVRFPLAVTDILLNSSPGWESRSVGRERCSP